VDIDLGDGKTVTVKEIDELTSGDGNAVRAAQTVYINPETEEPYVPGSQNDRMHTALLRRIITSWNLQWPLPHKRPDSLDKLTLKQQKLLYDGVKGHFAAIREAEQDDPTEKDSDPTGDSES
jgi:hypothetical protein